MSRKLDKRERKIIKLFFRQPEGRRREANRLAEEAAALMGISQREWAQRFIDREQEARIALQSVASKDDRWMPEFTPPDGGRDWEGFFAGLIACLEKFLPTLLGFL